MKRIALATDLGDGSPELFAHCLALSIAARAELYLVHVVDGDPPDPAWRNLPTVRALLEAWKVLGPDATAEDFAAIGIRVHPLDFVPVERTPTGGWGPSADSTRASVTRHLAELDPDLVVLGTHARHGFDRLLQPSVAEPVARDLRLLTLVVPTGVTGFVDPATGRIGLERVLVPLTAEVDPQPVVDALVRFLSAFGVEQCAFTLVHVGPDATLPSPSLPDRAGWTWKTDRRTGGVVEQILQAEVEHRPDLVAMGTEGSNGFLDGLRGTTTERVLRRTRTPLLAVPVGGAR